MIKLGIIGASGKAGSALFKKAAADSEFEVTAFVRDEKKARTILGPKAHLVVKDAFDLTKDDLKGQDVIVDAFATAPQMAYLHVDLATKLIALFRNEKQRLIFILGAGSLKTGEDQHLFVEDIKKMPGADSWVEIPKNQLLELNFLKDVVNVDWVGVSPGAEFKLGPAAQNTLYGQDDLLFNDHGASFTTYDTMANVLIEEIKHPKHHQIRFTVINND